MNDEEIMDVLEYGLNITNCRNIEEYKLSEERLVELYIKVTFNTTHNKKKNTENFTWKYIDDEYILITDNYNNTLKKSISSIKLSLYFLYIKNHISVV